MVGSTRWLPAGLTVLALGVVGPLVPEAAPQYFGTNKVQYKTFDFEILETEHFDVYFYPEEREAAELAARLIERWYARLSTVFQTGLSSRQPLILYASHPDFQQTNVITGRVGEGTGGVTEAFKRRIVLPTGSSLGETDHVLGHELVHAFQFDLTSRGRAAGGGFPGVLRLPLWFVEGMAEYLTLGPTDPNTAMWVRDAVRQERLPSIRDLADPRYFPYRWGHALWAYVGGRWGDQVVADILLAAGESGSAEYGMEAVLGIPAAQLSDEWHDAIRAEYAAFAEAGRSASQIGRLIAGGPGFGEELNVSPAVSPDGTHVIFFSGRGLISVDLFLADARTGQIVRRVVNTAVDPHFSSLQFIRSAGAWAPDSRRFAFVGVSRGVPTLVLYDVPAGRIVREIPFPDLGEILNPAWSPDGRTIAFAATVGGLSDLFLYDLESEALRRLTHDAFTDLHPAWSPDGARLAFISDRFSSDMTRLDIGPLRLALINVGDGRVRPAGPAGTDQQTNPQWSPDGVSLLYISERTGIYNLYRLDLESGRAVQVTDLATGVSGITPLSPALSVAQQSGDVLFTAYEEGRHAIYRLAPEAVRSEVPPRVARVDRSPAVLPPAVREGGRMDLAALIGDAASGLPATPPGPVEPYRPRLALDYIGQPTIVAGMDPFGSFVGGGISFVFSDMLGDHVLATAVETSAYFGGGFADSLKNISAAGAYQNLKRRWNWGLAAEQVPYLSGFLEAGITERGNSLVGVERTTIFRQNNRALYGLSSYPINEAHRLEFAGGVQRVTFDQIVTSQFFSLTTGQFLGEDRSVASLGDPLNLGRASTALVYDTSVFGATSPISGRRYRLEVAPVTGTLNFTSALADVRQYVMPVRLYTIAGRVVHYGRYGRDGGDSRLSPLFIGYPNLVRGYDISSFSVAECRPDPGAPFSCPVFDRLLGSRLLVANAEFRFPLLRPFGLRQGLYGPVPVEVAFFGDAGVAWNQGESPALFGGERQGVTSAGVAFRINAFGFAIVELDIVRPFDRPGQGWMFQFSLVPGF